MTFSTDDDDYENLLLAPLTPDTAAAFKHVFDQLKQLHQAVYSKTEGSGDDSKISESDLSQTDQNVIPKRDGNAILDFDTDLNKVPQRSITMRSQPSVGNILVGGANYCDKASLDEDTYTLMMMTESAKSKEWILGVSAFVLQVILSSLVIKDQSSITYGSTSLNVPLHVKPEVRMGQFFTIVLVLMTQTDVLNSVNTLARLKPFNSISWKLTIGVKAGEGGAALWTRRVLFPQCLKLVQGVLVLAASLIIIIQGDNIVDLLKDFTALFVLSSIDDVFFVLASRGFFGEDLSKKSEKAIDVTIEPDQKLNVNGNKILNDEKFGFWLQSLTLLLLLSIMMMGWLFVIVGQFTGKYTKEKYPVCFFNNNSDVLKIGDEVCHLEFNSLECGFDGGDCVLFNDQYPDCVAENPMLLGDGTCDLPLNRKECGFDNGDCSERNRGREKDNFQCKLDVEKARDGDCDFDGEDKDVTDIMFCNCVGSNTQYVEALSENESVGLTASLSVDGSLLAVAGKSNSNLTSPGYIRIYDERTARESSSWSLAADFSDLVDGPFHESEKDHMTLAFSADSKMLILGDPMWNDRTGTALIFSLDDTKKWSKIGNLTGLSPGDRFGTSVSIGYTNSALSASVGAPGALSQFIIFSLSNSSDWTKIDVKLPQVEEFGASHAYSRDGSILIIGAPFEAGSVDFFNASRATYITSIPGSVAAGRFGSSVSLSRDGRIAAVGAYDGSYVKLFKYDEVDNTYVQLGDTIQGLGVSGFGWDVALSDDGDRLAVGCPFHDRRGDWADQSNIDVGATYIYSIFNSGWTSVDWLEGDAYKYSGASVALSGDGSRLAIGASGTADSKSHVRIILGEEMIF